MIPFQSVNFSPVFTDSAPAGRQSSDKANWGFESVCRLLSSISTITILLLLPSPETDTHLPSVEGERLSRPRLYIAVTNITAHGDIRSVQEEIFISSDIIRYYKLT